MGLDPARGVQVDQRLVVATKHLPPARRRRFSVRAAVFRRANVARK